MIYQIEDKDCPFKGGFKFGLLLQSCDWFEYLEISLNSDCMQPSKDIVEWGTDNIGVYGKDWIFYDLPYECDVLYSGLGGGFLFNSEEAAMRFKLTWG